MKKLLFVIALITMVIGCRRHIYHTYYGDIDIDTMTVIFYDLKDSLPCYQVGTSELDSIEKVPGIWGYIYGPIRYYYCPQKDVYYYTFPDNQGNSNLRGYNPHTKKSYLPTNF